MKASIQIWIQALKAIVFQKDEFDFRVMSEIKAFLPLLAYQQSNSDVQILFFGDIQRKLCFTYKVVQIETVMFKKVNKLELKSISLNTEVCQD